MAGLLAVSLMLFHPAVDALVPLRCTFVSFYENTTSLHVILNTSQTIRDNLSTVLAVRIERTTMTATVVLWNTTWRIRLDIDRSKLNRETYAAKQSYACISHFPRRTARI